MALLWKHTEKHVFCAWQRSLSGSWTWVGVSRDGMGTLQGQQPLAPPETLPPFVDCEFIRYVSLKWNDCVLTPHSGLFICIPFIYSNTIFFLRVQDSGRKKSHIIKEKLCLIPPFCATPIPLARPLFSFLL